MRYSRILPVALILVLAEVAHAQMGPGMGGPMQPGMPGAGGGQPSGEEKKEGVAEAAPKTPGLLSNRQTEVPMSDRVY